MGTIKDKNGMGLTEAEGTKKRWQGYTEELHEKDLHDPDNHDDVITHLEPDILACEVKWALGSITTNKGSGGDGIPVELFQILKDDAVKVLCSICQQMWKTEQWPQDWERSDFIPIPKDNGKQCSGQISFQSQRRTMASNAQTTVKLHSSHALFLTSISALLTMPKPLTVWITINWKILKEIGIPDHLTCLLRNLHVGQEATVRTGHGTTDWFQIGKGVC